MIIPNIIFNKITVTRVKKEISYKNGQLNLDELNSKINKDTAAVIMQNPNFFGIIEDVEAIAEITHKNKSLLILSADPS